MSTPPLGHTRCYWTLLSPSLQFLYLDPVLQAHLSDPPEEDVKPSATAKSKADGMIGKTLLDYVHPEEQNSAKIDLGQVLDSKTLHGSVTRVRFSSLTKIRREMGCLPWINPKSVGADKDYIPVDLVINWAADGLVLCFLHAVVDIDPDKENDFSLRETQAWTNWCGTPALDPEQVQMMFGRLLVCGGAETPGGSAGGGANGAPGGGGVGGRVFQILVNDSTKAHLISWPPTDHRHLARLAHNINLDAVNTDAKTSCTRRFKASNFPPELGAPVESIFIPHGSIIFACHKVGPPNLMSPSYYDYNITPNSHSYSYQPWNRSAGTAYYDPATSASAPPPGPNGYNSYESYLPPPDDEVPPPRRRASPTHHQPSSTSQSSGRGNRPAGVLKCTSCKATTSPEWRKGPSGRKELCNACGLRYARSRAKKEGSSKSSRGGHGGKARSSTSVAVMRREGSVASSTGGSKTDGGGGGSAGGGSDAFDSPAAAYPPGPAPGYDYYRGREDEQPRFPDAPPRPDDHRFKASPQSYDRPAYPEPSRASAYPPGEGDRYYHPSPLASYERRRE